MEIASKSANNSKDPIVTDLNLTIATMKMSGKRNFQIAKELGISDSAVCQHLNRVKDLVNMKANGEIADPINNQRARLLKRLRKTDTVIGKALRDYGKSDRLSVNASNVAIAVNKGLGVLVDKTEVSGQVDLLAQRRDDMRARLDACRQFGLNPADELKAVEAEVVDAEVDKVEVPRETPIEAAIAIKQPIIATQPAPEGASEPAGKPQSKPECQTLSKSKW